MSIATRVNYLERHRTDLRIVPAPPVPPLNLDQPADLLAVVAEQINAVRADGQSDPTEKARVVGLLASVALRVMEGRDLAARLEAVERVLKLRKQKERENERARKQR